MKIILKGLIISVSLFFLSFSAIVAGQQATATWNPNPESDIAGYKLSYGTTSGIYPITIDTGNVTKFIVTGLQVNTPYFFVLQAYDTSNLISPYSIEVPFIVPDPNCIFPLGADVIQVFPTAIQYTGSGGANSKARLDFQLSSISPVTSVIIQSNGLVLSTILGTNLTSLAGMWFTVPAISGSYPLSIAVNNLYGCARVQSTIYTVTVQ